MAYPEKKKQTDVLQGTLDLIVLRMLQSAPANGWELMNNIEALSGSALSVNYGTLYPALHRLEARGWVASEWAVSDNNRRAKYYSLTKAGRKQLEEERRTWERFSTGIELIMRNA